MTHWLWLSLFTLSCSKLKTTGVEPLYSPDQCPQEVVDCVIPGFTKGDYKADQMAYEDCLEIRE